MNIRNESDGTRADLFWDDLNQETQEELFKLMGENGNYDIFPLATIKSETRRNETCQL